ncbi:MAG: hypothetical protein ACM3SR_01300 [Ignavibacteriales bacterium]
MTSKEIAKGKYKRPFLLEPPKPPIKPPPPSPPEPPIEPPPPPPPEPPIEPPPPEPPIEVVSNPRLYHNSGLVSLSLQEYSTGSLTLRGGINRI